MKNLFKSVTSYDILNFLVTHNSNSFSLAEITSYINRDKANVSRELEKLVEEGIVSDDKQVNKRSYSLNQQYEGIKELSSLIMMSHKKELESRFNHTWLMAEEIPNIDPYFTQIWMDCFVSSNQPGGNTYNAAVAIHKGYHMWFYFEKKDAELLADRLVSKFTSDPSFMKKVNNTIVQLSDKLTDFTKTVPQENLSQLTNEELLRYNSEHIKIHTEYYKWAWIPVAADMFTNALTNASKNILKKHGVSEEKLNDYLTVLTQPTRPSLLKVEKDNLTKIAIRVQNNKQQLQIFEDLYKKFKEEDVKLFGLYTHSPEYEAQFEKRVRDIISSIDKNILDDLELHYRTYFYTKRIFTEEQGVYSFEHYLKELVRMVNQRANLEDEYKTAQATDKKFEQEQNELVKKLQLSSSEQQFFTEWGEFMITKIYRRYGQLFALYRMNAILEEIAQRLGLPLKHLKFLTKKEYENALHKKIEIDQVELKKRADLSVYYAHEQGGEFITGQDAEKAVTYIRGAQENFFGITELNGQTGCRGYATGVVKIVNHAHEIQKVKQGDVLVSISTQPDLLPAMKKAAAFVTEQGGVTSHAAIVARELNIPCVIGTKIATKVLQDGMKVEVDATKGIVRIIE